MHKQIEKEGFRVNYAIVKQYNNFVLRQFYKRFEVVGYEENMVYGVPLILAGNHQNALIDALNMVGATRVNRQPTFITRSDVFGHFMTPILYSWKMLPIYRERDNMPVEERFKKNEEIFDVTVGRLSLNESVLIFPEGNHNRKLRIRNLQKGFARMAFKAEEQNDFKLGTLVVPMGLNYSDHLKFQGDMLINIGKPIPVENYIEQYKVNPGKALIAIRNDLRKAMRETVIDIRNDEYYDLIKGLSEIASPELAAEKHGPGFSLRQKFDISKQIIAGMDEKIERADADLPEWKENMQKYLESLKELKIRDHTVSKAPQSLLGQLIQAILLLLGLPFHLYGVLCNYLPYKLAEQLAVRNFKDDHFHTSIMMASSMVIYPLFAFLQTGIVWGIFGDWQIALGYLFSIPFSGKFAIYYSEQIKKWWSRVKFNSLLRKKDQQALKIKDLRNDFAKLAKSLTTKREKVTT